MATTLENYCEQIEVLMLQAQAGLSGVSVVREDEDASAANDRVVVKAGPRQIELPGRVPGSVEFWKIPVTVTAHLVTRTSGTATIDTYAHAIEAANNTSAPAAALTIANAQFPNGLIVEETSDGQWDNEDNQRMRSKTFNFIARV
jgi:hypothetical protein